MMTADQMIQRFGKKKAVDMMVNCPRNGKTGAEKDRGIKGRVRFKMCEHGKWVVENYEPKPCADCIPEIATKGKDFKPYFNIGLGAFVESRSEEKRYAKKIGLVEAG